MLQDGYADLPAGKLANVATYLEMFAPPQPRPDPPGIDATLKRIERPDLAWYRALFERIGGPYLWFSRLAMNDTGLAKILHDARDEVYALRIGGNDAGLLELDFRIAGECELVFFGVDRTAIGRGIGRWMMNRALQRAWSQPIRRMTVHTCSLDHPGMVPFYVRSGFTPFKRAIEYYDDPRAIGVLPKSIAPDIPLL